MELRDCWDKIDELENVVTFTVRKALEEAFKAGFTFAELGDELIGNEDDEDEDVEDAEADGIDDRPEDDDIYIPFMKAEQTSDEIEIGTIVHDGYEYLMYVGDDYFLSGSGKAFTRDELRDDLDVISKIVGIETVLNVLRTSSAEYRLTQTLKEGLKKD